jgi:hypothetical protein
MEPLKLLKMDQLVKGHHILLDIELARMHNSEELIETLHKKFYTVIPHKNDHPILTDTQIYVKRALLIKQIKGY